MRILARRPSAGARAGLDEGAKDRAPDELAEWTHWLPQLERLRQPELEAQPERQFGVLLRAHQHGTPPGLLVNPAYHERGAVPLSRGEPLPLPLQLLQWSDQADGSQRLQRAELNTVCWRSGPRGISSRPTHPDDLLLQPHPNIETALVRRRVDYQILTGQTPTKDRGALVRRFRSGAAPVFLISLKAGGVGLHLTAADTVIHYDPWWNPSMEAQATDRAHRIGQDKPVLVYRLICAGTVEEEIQAMHGRKAELARAGPREDGTCFEPLRRKPGSSQPARRRSPELIAHGPGEVAVKVSAMWKSISA